MVTLMTWQSNSGERRNCNASCHNAKLPTRRCVCGGRYHSSARQPGGVEQAVRDTWEEAVQEAEKKAKAEGMELDVSRMWKFIGLEPANPAIHANSDNHAIHANPKKRRLWSTINRDNQKIGAQGQLPLEVS